MKYKLIVLISLILSLSLVTACDIFSETGIRGHVVLSNTEVIWDEFQTFEQTSSNIKKTTALDDKKEAYRSNQIIVKFSDNKTRDEILEKYQVINQITAKNTYLLKVEDNLEQVISDLEAKAGVEYAERNFLYYLTSTSKYPTQAKDYKKQLHYSAISLPEAWSFTTGSNQVKVAVLDTGIAKEHPEFEGVPIEGKNFANSHRYDYDETDYTDRNSHGTHVAATIASGDNNKITGVNWQSSLLVAKVFPDPVPDNEEDEEGASSFEIAEAISWANEKGADIINMSLGSPLPSKAMQEAISESYSNGVTIIAASGNSASGAVSFPARYQEVIAVGAINSELELASFSNTGVRLDFVAPGVDVYSAIIGDDYESWPGTSMAAPHVSGVAALMIAAEAAETPEEIKELLKLTAQDLGAQNDGNRGWDSSYGYGLINAHAAITRARISDAVVFVGQQDEDIIYKLETTTVNSEGFYELDLSDEHYVYAWIDVNGNGKIDVGDYLARSENPVEDGVNLNLELGLITDSEFKELKVQ